MAPGGETQPLAVIRTRATRDEMSSKPADPTLAETWHRVQTRERRAVLARVLSALTHALGTPLNVVSGRASMITLDASDAGAVARHAAIIQDQTRAVSELLQGLRAYARLEPVTAEPCALEERLRAVCAEVEPEAVARGVALSRGGIAPVAAHTDVEAWTHVTAIVLRMAVRHAIAGSSIAVTLERRKAVVPHRERGRAAEGEHACFTARSAGLHLPAALVTRPDAPWFAALSPESADAALTVAVAYEVVRSMHGWLSVLDFGSAGGGLEVFWPVDARRS